MEKPTRVLIVEDDFLVREMIKGQLNKLHYTVVGETSSGSEVHRLIEIQRPDVILMDIKMPEMDGIQATAQIQERHPTPVVILSAYDTSELVGRASAAGAGAYLVKPPSVGELERAIRVAIARFADTLELRRLNEELRARNEELDTFASIVAHDLQEPLRTIKGYLQLLTRQCGPALDERGEEYIHWVNDGADRMHAMIQGLLTFARVGTRGRTRQPVDCEALLERVLGDLRATIRAQEAVITHTPLPTILADEAQLEQVFQNLISNALKFHGETTPRIRIGARDDDRAWAFFVQDNGIGMDLEHTARIFEIFQRLHTEEEYPGTGIGLAVCKRIIDRHGGRIWVDSAPGAGATFHFTLPKEGPTWSSDQD
jgi:light-regulated signal transduction histidine kinase (bacteriophytochrome)